MVTNKEKLLLLGKKITDRIPYKLGLKKLDEESPEFFGFVNVLNDEMVDVALKMKVRHAYSLKDMVALTGVEEEHLYELLQEMSVIGLLEYHYGEKYDQNIPHTRENRLYVLPQYVPGSAELLNMNPTIPDTNPEVTKFFERMTFLPLEKVTRSKNFVTSGFVSGIVGFMFKSSAEPGTYWGSTYRRFSRVCGMFWSYFSP